MMKSFLTVSAGVPTLGKFDAGVCTKAPKKGFKIYTAPVLNTEEKP
jgi:hypothetical protein